MIQLLVLIPLQLKYVPECYKTQEMCNKTALRCFFVLDSISDKYKTKEICDIVVSSFFYIVYCPDKYETQRTCSEVVDDSLAALKLIPDWFVTSKII